MFAKTGRLLISKEKTFQTMKPLGAKQPPSLVSYSEMTAASSGRDKNGGSKLPMRAAIQFTTSESVRKRFKANNFRLPV